MTSTPKKPTAPSVATLTKKLKAAEAEITQLKDALLKLNEHAAQAQAEYGNGQYSLGYDEGLADGRAEMQAAVQAQSVIGRFFSR